MRKKFISFKQWCELNNRFVLLNDWNFNKNINIKPENISYYSLTKVWWKCSKGHEWEDSIGHRISGRNCPYCSGKKVLKGFNDFETLYPFLAKEWDYSKNNLKPFEVTAGSQKKVWWKCPNGHNSYLATIYSRKHGSGCPICNTMFLTSFPEQTIYFYIKKIFPDAINRYKKIFKNSMELDIFIPSINVGIEYDGCAWHNSEIAKKRERKKYLICKDNNIFLYRIREENDSCENADKAFVIPAFYIDKTRKLNDTIKTIIKEITNIKNPDIDIDRDMFKILEYKKLKYEDSLAYLCPEVSKEWLYSKNGNLKPENVTPGTELKVWWKCSKGHEWKGSIINRAKGHGCDICAREQRKITSHENRLKTRDLLINSKCVIDWDYSKNKHAPDFYTKGSGYMVWWKCHKCGHEWRTRICSRTRDYKNGCPACSNRILVRGKNDLLTTNPILSKEWDYINNKNLKPSDVAQWSHSKVWWKCSKCGFSYQATPSNRVFGKGCPSCRGRKIAVGINDLCTTRPDIAIDWHPTKNGSLRPQDVTKGRNIKVWWKCHKCGHVWKDTVNHRNCGRGCTNCNKTSKTISKRK